MQIEIVLLIILALVISLAAVLWLYSGMRKKSGSYTIFLMICRFIAVFGVLLLLINPKLVKEEVYLEKSNLILLADNSSSIENAGAAEDVNRILDEIYQNSELNEKYELRRLNFDREIDLSDSLSFDKQSTDIHNALRTIQRTYGNRPSAIVMLSDGNQTVGTDYEYLNFQNSQKVFPVILGDTTKYEDISISQVNVNRYAFLKNRYPVEVLLRYDGNSAVTTELNLSVNGINRHKQGISMNSRENAIDVEVLLEADTPGTQLISIELRPIANEKNLSNNLQKVAVEILDEKTRIVIISELSHPDIGALIKSIESNDQRTVDVIKPTEDVSLYNEADAFVLYQPNRRFENIYNFIKERNINYFTITGDRTDWNYLNRVQSSFQKTSFNQKEEVSPLTNAGFSVFDIGDFNTENFPPLTTTLGDLLVTKAYNSIVDQRIKGVDIGDPLLALIDSGNGKECVLFGENIWKWRVQNYRNNNDFDAFDELISKIILYLTSDERKERLSLEYENIYKNANYASIRASYFTETFDFDDNATVRLYLTGIDNEIDMEMPMLLKGGFYEADLSALRPGTFNFTVRVENKNEMRSGQFTILDFDVEKQFLTTNHEKLDRLATKTGGQSYYPDRSSDLIGDLIDNDQYKPQQKSEQNVVSLIDFKVLLAIVVAAFTTEWIIRKYNGLI